MIEKIIEDKELGRLIVRVNARARRFVFRTKGDAIYVTVPPGSTSKELNEVIENLRSKLSASREKVVTKQIDLNYRIDAEYFRLTLVRGTRKEFLASSRLGKTEIVCPPGVDFDNEETQLWLRKVIEEALRRNAKAVLPARLLALSKQYDLPFRDVKINSSRGRWGSCSTRGNINLSYFLLLLPTHLIDYVLLHELCHTLEMSHNDRFWELLDRYTDGKSLLLRKELKGFKTEI